MKKRSFTTVKIFVFSLILFLKFTQLSYSQLNNSQCYYNYTIDTLLMHISSVSLTKTVQELTGVIPCVVGGDTVTILTRAYNFPGNEIAAQYIFEKFVSYGYSPYYWQFDSAGRNVIARKPGTKYPNQRFIICSHYDSYPWLERSLGSDDNATGTCEVLEAARLLAPMSFDYTLEFVTFDEEERWLYGSDAYADSCHALGDSIVAVVNFDMIAYDYNGDNKTSLMTNEASMNIDNVAYSTFMMYVPSLKPKISLSPTAASDHYPFWQNGYKAIWPYEDESEYNFHINSVHDSMYYFNNKYWLSMARAGVALFATLGKDYVVEFTHNPIQSGTDTNSREADVIIRSHKPLATGTNSPRLYYSAGLDPYVAINASYHNLDTFKFIIPGFPVGTRVSYYISCQDSTGELMATLPAGGRGFNPPGTRAPRNVFIYYMTASFQLCSIDLPMKIPPMHVSYDTINVLQQYNLVDLNLVLSVLNPVDRNLSISLVEPLGSSIYLSNRNGEQGSNYINTIFDDEAVDSIKFGTPPFTGSYIPEQPLSTFDGKAITGPWLLRVTNLSITDTATLTHFCLNFTYSNLIGITKNSVPVIFSLMQNYPNPFNPATKITYSVAGYVDVKLTVYDVLGREVAVLVNEKKSSGTYSVEWNASGYSSGVYFYRLQAGDFSETKKMLLIK